MILSGIKQFGTLLTVMAVSTCSKLRPICTVQALETIQGKLGLLTVRLHLQLIRNHPLQCLNSEPVFHPDPPADIKYRKPYSPDL